MVINPLRNIVNKKLELVLTVMPEVCVCFVPGVRVKVTVDLLKLSLEFYTKLPQLLNVLSELEHIHTHRPIKQPTSTDALQYVWILHSFHNPC